MCHFFWDACESENQSSDDEDFDTISSGDNEAESDMMDHIESPALTALASMVTCNSVVVIKPDSNSLLDYFLLSVTSGGGVTLDEEETSDFGHLFPKGAKVIKGNYLEYKKSTKRDLCSSRDTLNAIVPYASLIYCALELSPGQRTKSISTLK